MINICATHIYDMECLKPTSNNTSDSKYVENQCELTLMILNQALS